MKKILICHSVELDSSQIISALSGAYEIKTVSTLNDARDLFSGFAPDAVICGENFSGISASELSAEIKVSGAKLLTVISSTRDQPYHIAESGTDDVIFIPFCEAELLTRINAFFYNKASAETKIFQNGQLTIDYENCRVFIGSSQLHLTMLEYKLLCVLSKNCGKTVTYNALLRELWQTPIGNEILSLRVFVNAIRKKILVLGDQNNYIQTQTGTGYLMPILG